jgi:hypothetical protein
MRVTITTAIFVVLVLVSNASGDCEKFMLFGGDNHDVYLGCINCSEYARDNLYNSSTRYGRRTSRQSIWNVVGSYGSTVSRYSPWNVLASEPPVIVDDCGNFYGRFTVNTSHPQRTTVPWIVALIEMGDQFGRRQNYYTPTPIPTDPDVYDEIVGKSDEEQVLDGVLGGIIAGLQAGKAVKDSRARQRRARESHEEIDLRSSIDGDFEGFGLGNRFVLANGDVWEQTSYCYEPHYAYCPDVTIYKTRNGFEIAVEGMSERVRVRWIE